MTKIRLHKQGFGKHSNMKQVKRANKFLTSPICFLQVPKMGRSKLVFKQLRPIKLGHG